MMSQSSQTASSSLSTTLGYVAIAIGAIALIAALFMDRATVAFSIFIGLGITFFPAGIFTLLANYSFSQLLLLKIDSIMGKTTDDLKISIEGINKTTGFLEESKHLGLVQVYADRSTALDEFLNHALSYVTQVSKDQKDNSRKIVVVGSSLKGIWDNPYFAEKFTRVIERGQEVNCDFNFLLTHPHYSRHREGQESREKDDIAKEILHAISWLNSKNISSNAVKLYKGTPTCFLIATSKRMLINPYPYQIEAFRCFCLEVVPTASTHSIYNSYWVNHFRKPWEGELSKEDHRLVVNALSYQYFPLDGPVPNKYHMLSDSSSPLADVVAIQDSGECYISLNISHLPAQIAYYEDGSDIQSVIELGSEFSVRFLDPQTQKWDEIGNIPLNERRRGFWHATLRQRYLSAYLMIGVFSCDKESPFEWDEDSLNFLKGQKRPILWQKLSSIPKGSETSDAAYSKNLVLKSDNQAVRQI